MSPLGPQDLVLHRLQHHVTQSVKMATCCPLCCLSASPLLDSMVIISSLAKTRITRTSSKNIMPVLDTGHLLAFPRDTPDTGGRGVRWGGGGTKGEGGEGASGWDYGGAVKGGKRRRRDDLTTCSIRKALFLCAGPLPWTASPGQTKSPHWAMPHAAVNSHCDLQICSVSLSESEASFWGRSWEVCSLILYSALKLCLDSRRIAKQKEED